MVSDVDGRVGNSVDIVTLAKRVVARGGPHTLYPIGEQQPVRSVFTPRDARQRACGFYSWYRLRPAWWAPAKSKDIVARARCSATSASRAAVSTYLARLGALFVAVDAPAPIVRGAPDDARREPTFEVGS
jgi:hypothetical protein